MNIYLNWNMTIFQTRPVYPTLFTVLIYSLTIVIVDKVLNKNRTMCSKCPPQKAIILWCLNKTYLYCDKKVNTWRQKIVAIQVQKKKKLSLFPLLIATSLPLMMQFVPFTTGGVQKTKTWLHLKSYTLLSILNKYLL